MADLKRQNDKLERQMREIMKHMSATSSFTFEESPDNSATQDSSNSPASTDKDDCIVCMDGPKTIALLPCKHLCLCRNCSETGGITVCPICAVAVESTFNIVPTG